MGGGDLNTKKSWHPNTIKNQEKVWKAEQAKANEKRRIDDLRREIDNERSKEELVQHGQTFGVLPESSSKKMDWMYKQPNESVDREQYLLGKKVDKAFENIVAKEKSSHVNAEPKNHVEHECIPFSIRNLSNDSTSREFQVDMARKMMEDPLVAIRKKELESRAQLLQNPVKLKELTTLLKNEQLKRKEKKKKKSRDSPDLDKKLAEKLNKLSDKSVNLDELLKSRKSKKKSKKKKKLSSDSDSEEEERDRSRKRKHEKEGARNSSAQSKHHSAEQSSSYKGRESGRARRRHSRDSSEERPPQKKPYGLVKGDGTPLELHKTHKEYKSRDAPGKTSKPNTAPVSRTKLSEEEKEKRRKEMMKDAVVRDREREHNVKYHREKDRKQAEKERNVEYREDFVEKHLRESSKHLSVESRLKSNVYNIQRSSRHMDGNFAKR